MAKAFLALTYATNMPNDSKLVSRGTLTFFGTDVGGNSDEAGPFEFISSQIAIASSVPQIQNAVSDDVIAFGATKGLTVNNGDVMLASLQMV